MPATIFKGDQPPVGANQDDLFIKQSDGTIYYFNGSIWVQIGALPTGTAGGDLTGTYPNPTIKTSVALTSPTVNSGLGVGTNSNGAGIVVGANGTNALTVGQNGLTNPGFRVNTSDGTNATGVEVQSHNAASNVDIRALSSGTNEALTINAKGSGGLLLQNVATAGVQIGAPTGADKGAGTLNAASGLYENGNRVMGNLIADTLLSVAATNITLSSIPGTYKHLRLVMQGRGDGAAAGEVVFAQFNADTGANYESQRVLGSGAAASSIYANAQTSVFFGSQPAANATANRASVTVIDIPNYVGTTFDKSLAGLTSNIDGTSGDGAMNAFGANWASTAAITSIKIFPQTSTNFVAGTRVTLYGLN